MQPPSPPGAERQADAMRRGFRVLNRAMVPALRSPCGKWAGSPWGGYFALLTTTGRRTGLPRTTPLNYAIVDGDVHLLAGFGTRADWYRNLLADPAVTVRLPGRTLAGRAEPVDDPAAAVDAAVRVARNAGLALVLEGLNPLATTDDELRLRLAGRPVVRLRSEAPLLPGPWDPGGWAWLMPHVVLPGAVLAVLRTCRRRPALDR